MRAGQTIKEKVRKNETLYSLECRTEQECWTTEAGLFHYVAVSSQNSFFFTDSLVKKDVVSYLQYVLQKWGYQTILWKSELLWPESCGKTAILLPVIAGQEFAKALFYSDEGYFRRFLQACYERRLILVVISGENQSQESASVFTGNHTAVHMWRNWPEGSSQERRKLWRQVLFGESSGNISLEQWQNLSSEKEEKEYGVLTMAENSLVMRLTSLEMFLSPPEVHLAVKSHKSFCEALEAAFEIYHASIRLEKAEQYLIKNVDKNLAQLLEISQRPEEELSISEKDSIYHSTRMKKIRDMTEQTLESLLKKFDDLMTTLEFQEGERNLGILKENHYSDHYL